MNVSFIITYKITIYIYNVGNVVKYSDDGDFELQGKTPTGSGEVTGIIDSTTGSGTPIKTYSVRWFTWTPKEKPKEERHYTAYELEPAYKLEQIGGKKFRKSRKVRKSRRRARR